MKNAIAEDRLRLPSFDCPNPNCTAKNIAFAVSREAKNESELIPLEYVSENTPADFAVVCPKCKRKYVLCRHRELPIMVGSTAVSFPGRQSTQRAGQQFYRSSIRSDAPEILQAFTTAAFTLDVYGHVTNQMKEASASRMELFISAVSS